MCGSVIRCMCVCAYAHVFVCVQVHASSGASGDQRLASNIIFLYQYSFVFEDRSLTKFD